MDLKLFRQIVDGAKPGISICKGDLPQLYKYVGLESQGGSYTSGAVSKALYERIKSCFSLGHNSVRRKCISIRKDLIREHILLGISLDPYFEVLDRLQDAIGNDGHRLAEIGGDWNQAIQGAIDHIHIVSLGKLDKERCHTRDFEVAKAARFLRDQGFPIQFEPGLLSLKEAAETRLVKVIEKLVANIGGINVARRIFDEISSNYDDVQQRYHVVRNISMTGGGLPQIPWGYLIQLSAKHILGHKPLKNNDEQWNRLCNLSKAYAALLNVQSYTPNFFGTMSATDLLPYLQEMAVYDTLFRIPQIRPTDIGKIARGIFGWLDMGVPRRAGWSINQVLEIIDYLLKLGRNVRGPIFVMESDIQKSCPHIPHDIVMQILNDVLSHPLSGANQNFSRPTDAPTPKDPNLKNAGHNFSLHPLLKIANHKFVLLDCSVCAPACLEALLTSLRAELEKLDERIGVEAERFIEAEFASHGITSSKGSYTVDNKHGECDLVIEEPKTVIFFEIKKKALTRPAMAGSDAHLLADLAFSLLAAQVQAGWHEVRLLQHNHLDLMHDKVITRIDLNGRQVERVAVSLFDFGSFQDRILLKQFLEAVMNAKFTTSVPKLNKKFDKINEALVDIRKQIAALYPGQAEISQPFFNCWFISLPCLLILLDGVTDVDGFKASLWSCRHMVTGSSDLYFDLSYRRQLERSGAPKPVNQ